MLRPRLERSYFILASILIDETTRTETTQKSAVDQPTANDGLTRIAIELGIWLSSVDSYIRSAGTVFGTERPRKDLSGDVRNVLSIYRKCSLLAHQLRIELSRLDARPPQYGSAAEMTDLCVALSELSMITAPERCTFSEFSAYAKRVFLRSAEFPAAIRSIKMAEAAGSQHLPKRLLEMSDPAKVSTNESASIALALPKFGRSIFWLDVIGRMLREDRPLRPALAILAYVSEQLTEMTRFINARLDELADKDAEAFGMLDAASYTASIEVKKVYLQELSGVLDVRQAPTLFAKVETAYSLLIESLQQSLAGFARLEDRNLTVYDLFPNFTAKKRDSVSLRDDLAAVGTAVTAAEADPSAAKLEQLRRLLDDFMANQLRSLFFKDVETFERFVEEVRLARADNELVPTLHRFSAYIETLLGQVKLRSVLAEDTFG